MLSFRVGGRCGWQAVLVALVFPIVIGLIVYGIAWMTGLARFDPRPGELAAQFAADSASPVTCSWPCSPWPRPSGPSWVP